MKARYTVTFETDSTAKSVKGEIEAGSLQMLASQAARAAKREEPRSRWGSVVIVLDRLEDAG